jgi:hypothetical protein
LAGETEILGENLLQRHFVHILNVCISTDICKTQFILPINLSVCSIKHHIEERYGAASHIPSALHRNRRGARFLEERGGDSRWIGRCVGLRAEVNVLAKWLTFVPSENQPALVQTVAKYAHFINLKTPASLRFTEIM